MRYFLLTLAVLLVSVVGILGFRGTPFRKPPLYIYPDMEFQPKLRPQNPSGFFPNGMTSQKPVEGTIAQTEPAQTATGPVFPFEDHPYNTGVQPGTATNYIEISPVPINATMMARGQQRYTIYCTPCHGALGDGNGMPKKIGAMPVVANLHDQRMVEMSDGELFYVITHGRNNMGAYGGSVPVADRWAIVAYLRALQLARLGTVDDVPQELRANLK